VEPFSKLKWLCRRGTKELDYLLEGFLLNQYSQLESNNQVLFIELLGLQDSQLILYLLGNQLPESTGLAKLVKQIRNNANV